MKLTDTYEWIVLDDDHAKMGITKKAQKEIGEIVHIHFPKKGDLIKKGDPLLVLESTKSAIDTYAPISGEVIEVNSPLMDSLSMLNDDPEGRGWLILIKPHNLDEYHALEDYVFKT
ncbi:MAG: Glycine cleavage system H protein [Chlamydiia bacterium]|nr:Glycine cleavage system H protein [Chlamydiia bacterium]